MKVRVLLLVLLLTAAVPLGAAPPAPATPTLGLVAAADPEVTASLAAGARLALATWERSTGTSLELIVADPPRDWAAASGSAVEMAFDAGVIALLTPPDRQTAHLLAQLGTRAHLPVVATAEASSVTATGSFWVVSVATSEREAVSKAFERAYRAATGSGPDRWAVLGYDAAAAVAEAVHQAGLDRRAVADAWRAQLTIDGSSGPFEFDSFGRRRQVHRD
jgi:ABC-type branched-subunit amino acid transport system substrate-binding protein